MKMYVSKSASNLPFFFWVKMTRKEQGGDLVSFIGLDPTSNLVKKILSEPSNLFPCREPVPGQSNNSSDLL